MREPPAILTGHFPATSYFVVSGQDAPTFVLFDDTSFPDTERAWLEAQRARYDHDARFPGWDSPRARVALWRPALAAGPWAKAPLVGGMSRAAERWEEARV